MGLDDDTLILRQPGRLCVAPVAGSFTPTGAFPYGGTSLGYTRDGIDLDVVPAEALPLTAEDRRRPFDYLLVGSKELVCRVELLQWDDDAVNHAFYAGHSTASTSTGGRLVTVPGTFSDGSLGSDNTVKLLFAPDNARYGKFVYFPAALPWADEAWRLQAHRRRAFGLMLAFKALPDLTRAAAQTHLTIGDLRDTTI